MVIGPKELEKRIEEEREHLASLENEIDRCLEEGYRNGKEMVIIPESIFAGLRSTVIDEVLNRYISAGWTVSLEHEPVDVSYYEFYAVPTK